MECKTCHAKYHYCTSCDYDRYKPEGYCSENCWKESEEYKRYHTKLKKFHSSLNEEQQHDLWILWDNGILIDDVWEYIIDDIFINPINDK